MLSVAEHKEVYFWMDVNILMMGMYLGYNIQFQMVVTWY
jgi:hypothetical protein